MFKPNMALSIVRNTITQNVNRVSIHFNIYSSRAIVLHKQIITKQALMYNEAFFSLNKNLYI